MARSCVRPDSTHGSIRCMDRSIALPDDKPRVAWAKVARDVPRAFGLVVAALAVLLMSGLMAP